MTGSAPSRFARLVTFAALPLFALNLAMQVRFAIMGDKGWLLFAADEWVDGKKMEEGIVEVNPPLILWLYGIPAWLSRKFTFLTDYQWLGLMGIAALIIVVLLSRKLLIRHPVFKEDAERFKQVTLLIIGILTFIVSPVYFTDREHIMLMYCLPYVLRFMPSLARERFPLGMRVLIGLMAGVGFGIKPHAVLVFLALQAVYLVRERSPFILASVENIVIYLFGAAYLAAIYCFAPKYLTDIVPMVVAVYSSYNIKGTLHYYLPLAFLSASVPLLDFRPRYTTPYRRDIYYFMCVSAIYFGYALINNGWGYTYQPFFCSLTFITAWLLWEYDWLKRQHVARSLPSKQFDVGLKGCVYCLALNGIYGLFMLHSLLIMPDCGGYSGCIVNEPYVSAIKEKKIKSFGVMSGEFTRWPLISWQSGARWDTRFNNLWMMPGLMTAKENKSNPDRWAADQWILTYVGKAFAEDFNHYKPDAMFVDVSDEFFTYHHHIDALALLNLVPEFKAAWTRHYRYDSTLDNCEPKGPEASMLADKAPEAKTPAEKTPQVKILVGCKYEIYRWKD